MRCLVDDMSRLVREDEEGGVPHNRSRGQTKEGWSSMPRGHWWRTLRRREETVRSDSNRLYTRSDPLFRCPPPNRNASFSSPRSTPCRTLLDADHRFRFPDRALRVPPYTRVSSVGRGIDRLIRTLGERRPLSGFVRCWNSCLGRPRAGRCWPVGSTGTGRF